MSKDTEIVVIGSCNVDLISYTNHFPKAGETLCGDKFSMGCGGKGANQCVMAANLKAVTSMISCVTPINRYIFFVFIFPKTIKIHVIKVGNDTFGEMFLKRLKDLNIDIGHVHIVKDVSTGIAQAFVNSSGENCIVIVKGANDHLKREHIDKAKDIIAHAKVALFQLEIDMDVTLHALKVAQQNGCKTIFNPAPAVQDLSDEFLQHTTILICNETEAELLTGISVTSTESCEKAITDLLRKGPEFVVLTLGSKGAMLAGKDTEISQVMPDVSLLPEHVVDTTGAGDCFAGSLAYFLARRNDLSFKEQVRRAVCIASISVGKPGTQTSYPTYDELPSQLTS